MAKYIDDDAMDGEELWQNLVSRHENFILTLNSRVLRECPSRLTSIPPGGCDFHQILVHFQTKPHGGNCWLRLMELTAQGTVEVCDDSPTLDLTNLGADGSVDGR